MFCELILACHRCGKTFIQTEGEVDFDEASDRLGDGINWIESHDCN